VCQGAKCWPQIKANIIEANRKAGIKLTDNATAHIGGYHVPDLNTKMSHLDFKEFANYYA
jgi:hypothetical protein